MKGMQKLSHIILGLALVLTFNSCIHPHPAVQSVNELCNCAQDAGIDPSTSYTDYLWDNGEELKEFAKCALPVLEDIQEDLDHMNDEDRADYYAEAIKAMVDCDCGQKSLLTISKLYSTFEVDEQFGKLIAELEDITDRPSKTESLWDVDNFQSGYTEYDGYTICDCVNMDADGEYMMDICEDLQKEWGEMYELEDKEGQEEMMADLMDCIE